MITYKSLTEERRDPQVHKMIVVKSKSSFDGGYWNLLFASMTPYPRYYDVTGEEVPITAIEKWFDVTEQN